MLKKVTICALVFFTAVIYFARARNPYGGRLDFLLPLQNVTIDYIVFYHPDLLLEPLLRLTDNGGITSNVFKTIRFDSANNMLNLEVAEGLRWSDGSPLLMDDIYAEIKAELSSEPAITVLSDVQPSIETVEARSSINIRLIREPDLGFYFRLSRVYLNDVSGNNRWSGSFVPAGSEGGGSLSLRANIYSPAGRPYFDEIIFHPSRYDRFDAELLSYSCCSADFFGSIPHYYADDEDHPTILKSGEIYFVLLGDGIPEIQRQKIISIIEGVDLIAGITRGKGKKIEHFPLGAEDMAGSSDKLTDETENAGKSPPSIESVQSALEEYLAVYSYDSPVAEKLALRIIAVLKTAGYKDVKYHTMPVNKSSTDMLRERSLQVLQVPAIIDEKGADLKGLLQFINTTGTMEFLGLFGTEGINLERFEEAQKGLIDSGRIIYLFYIDKFRVFTCNFINAGESLDSVYFTD